MINTNAKADITSKIKDIFPLSYSTTTDRSPNISFKENKELWESVDALNNKLRTYKNNIPPSELENIFREAIVLMNHPDFKFAFEVLRANDDYDQFKLYSNRCLPSIIVSWTGESTNYLINYNYFLKRCTVNSIEYKFFLLSKDSWQPNTTEYADFPIWYTRTESSCQAKPSHDITKKYITKWKNLRPSLKGLYGQFADVIINELNDCLQDNQP
jgi:hypothetical protein